MQEIDMERHLKAIIELDIKYARSFLPEMPDDFTRLVALHKARYEITAVAPKLRHESRAWLEQHNFNRFKQIPWPPVGVLEE